MSESTLRWIPTSPTFLPSLDRQSLAVNAAHVRWPRARLVSRTAFDGVQLVDCGSNLERVACPACGQEIGLDWWQHAMDEDYDGFGFRLERYGATCCDRRVRLDELHYDWPMGFARFVVDVVDPDVAVVSSGDETMMADAMGCQVRFVWQRV